MRFSALESAKTDGHVLPWKFVMMVAWYWRRFRAMAPREAVGIRLLRWIRDQLWARPPQVPHNLRVRLHAFGTDTVAEFASFFPDDCVQIIRTAEQSLRGVVPIFNRHFEIGTDVDWHQDPFTHRQWAQDQVHKVNYRLRSSVDPKPVWELNRHQWLPDLILAYRLTGDERFARHVVALIESWINQNPWRTGINWVSPIELALRQISWLWVLRFLESTPILEWVTKGRIARSMYLQSKYVLSNLSLGSSANNHLVAEATGLLLVGDALGIEGWLLRAESILRDQVGRLINPDGSGAEQSIGYLTQTIEYYLLACGVSTSLREDPIVRTRLVAAIKFLSALMAGREEPPQIGDDDSARILPFASAYGRYASVINSVALLTRHAELLRADWRVDWRSYLIVGSAEFARVQPAPLQVSTVTAFPVGGYYILEAQSANHSLKALMDCGGLGLAPLAGHGHCDALGLIVLLDGEQIIADSGTYTYFGDSRWRSFFRGTSAHSTLRVDGREQSRYDGPFLVGERNDAICVAWEPGTAVTGEHDAFVGTAPRARHRRHLRLLDNADGFEIVDEIQGAGNHLAELFFHVSPEAVVRIEGAHRVAIALSGLTLDLRLPEGSHLQAYYGDSALPMGWSSKRYGERLPCFSILARMRFNDNVRLVTMLEARRCAA